jgi:hypothetical protein
MAGNMGATPFVLLVAFAVLTSGKFLTDKRERRRTLSLLMLTILLGSKE